MGNGNEASLLDVYFVRVCVCVPCFYCHFWFATWPQNLCTKNELTVDAKWTVHTLQIQCVSVFYQGKWKLNPDTTKAVLITGIVVAWKENHLRLHFQVNGNANRPIWSPSTSCIFVTHHLFIVYFRIKFPIFGIQIYECEHWNWISSIDTILKSRHFTNMKMFAFDALTSFGTHASPANQIRYVFLVVGFGFMFSQCECVCVSRAVKCIRVACWLKHYVVIVYWFWMRADIECASCDLFLLRFTSSVNCFLD